MRLRATAAVAVVATGSVVAAAFADKTTVKVQTPPPATVRAGATWDALLQLSRRGRRLDGFEPTLEIEDASGHRTFLGDETKPGVYRVRVVFPHRGEWSYRIRVGRQVVKHGWMHVLPQ